MISSFTHEVRRGFHGGGAFKDHPLYRFQTALSLFFIGGLLTGFVIGEGVENLGFQLIGGLIAALGGKVARSW